MAIAIGCTEERLQSFEAWLGRQVDVVRMYCASDAVGTGAWSRSRTLALQGRSPMMSWNVTRSTTNFNNIAAGAQDASINAIADYCEDIALDSGVTVWLSFNHEVENDGGFTIESWRAAASHVYDIIHTRAPNVTTYYAYLGGFYQNQFEGRGPADWWPDPVGPMELGVDYYDWRGATPAGTGDVANHYAQNNNRRPPADLEQPPGASNGTDALASSQSPPGSGVNSWMELAEHFGVPLNFPEFGWAITPQTTSLLQPWITGRRERIQAWADYHRDDPRITALAYFEWDSGGYTDPFTGPVALAARVNWRLSGGIVPADPQTATAFDSISGGTPSTPTASAGVGAILG